MKIALIGPTGFVGSAVLTEALSRGHAVTALSRTPAKLAPQTGLTAVQADATDPAQVATAVAGTDAVVNAYNPGWTHPAIHDEFLRGTRAIFEGVKRAGVKRLLTVGGLAACTWPRACSWWTRPPSPPSGSRARWPPGRRST